MSAQREQLERGIQRLFGDTSVPRSETKRNLETLRDQIDSYIEELESED